jgi:hypothetical protein
LENCQDQNGSSIFCHDGVSRKCLQLLIFLWPRYKQAICKYGKYNSRTFSRWRFQGYTISGIFSLRRYKDGGVLTLQKSITVHVDLKDAKK